MSSVTTEEAAPATGSGPLISNSQTPVVSLNGNPDLKAEDNQAGNAVPVTTGSAKPSELVYPKSRINLLDRYIDEPRELRVGVIGGGLAGVLAGILLPVKVPGIKLTIFEKNRDFVST